MRSSEWHLLFSLLYLFVRFCYTGDVLKALRKYCPSSNYSQNLAEARLGKIWSKRSPRSQPLLKLLGIRSQVWGWEVGGGSRKTIRTLVFSHNSNKSYQRVDESATCQHSQIKKHSDSFVRDNKSPLTSQHLF